MQATILRPGLLVSLRTSVRGNVKYQTTDLGTTQTVDGAEESRWETNKLVRDKAEQERAIKARSKARSVISAVCSHSDFGLLCLLENRAKLDEAIKEAQRIATDFNMDSRWSRLSVNVVTGEVAPNDALAIQGIKREMRELMEDMEAGMKRAATNPEEAVEQIRAAANKARSVGQMLTPDAQETVQKAINAARAVARQIVKAGEGMTFELDRASLGRVTQARTAFLDLDEAAPIAEVESDGRAVDIDPEPTEPKAGLQAAAPLFDL